MLSISNITPLIRSTSPFEFSFSFFFFFFSTLSLFFVSIFLLECNHFGAHHKQFSHFVVALSTGPESCRIALWDFLT